MGTIENLTKAFIGESQARNRYTIYAKIAQKEGFEQIGAIGSHLELIERRQGFKGFNQNSVSVIIQATDPRI